MFARVITTQAETEGIENLIDLARQQLPVARSQPGFAGYYLLADEAGKLIIISLWESRAHMEEVARDTAAGIREQGTEAVGLVSPRLDIYEVKLHA
jgi:heme-degrading monooxygenase HmoA